MVLGLEGVGVYEFKGIEGLPSKVFRFSGFMGK